MKDDFFSDEEEFFPDSLHEDSIPEENTLDISADNNPFSEDFSASHDPDDLDDEFAALITGAPVVQPEAASDAVTEPLVTDEILPEPKEPSSGDPADEACETPVPTFEDCPAEDFAEETSAPAAEEEPLPEEAATCDAAASDEAADVPAAESDKLTEDLSAIPPREASTTETAEDSSRPHRERPPHKGRPRRKKGDGLFGIPHLIAALIWLAVIVAVGVSLGRMIWVAASDVLAFGRDEKEVVVTITSDDSMEDIANKLHDAGLVRYPGLFKVYADLAVDEGEITTGTFTLNTLYDYHALVNGMSPKSGNRKVIEDVLIPEGFSCRQIFALLEEKGICKVSDLEEYAANGELKEYWFLSDVERGDKYCLEGFLFPDTYDFYENSNPRHALEKMLNNFEYRFTEEMGTQLDTLNANLSEKMRENGFDEAFVAENQLSIHDLVTVASLIEKEMANEKESFKIASVIYNRLFSWGDNPRYLNIDAAIFYALGGHKEALTAEDLQIDSPYNTYTHTGLVPGPIANPGLTCLQAALDPEETNFYYYVLDPEAGTHHFSRTYEEHQKFIDSLG